MNMALVPQASKWVDGISYLECTVGFVEPSWVLDPCHYKSDVIMVSMTWELTWNVLWVFLSHHGCWTPVTTSLMLSWCPWPENLPRMYCGFCWDIMGGGPLSLTNLMLSWCPWPENLPVMYCGFCWAIMGAGPLSLQVWCYHGVHDLRTYLECTVGFLEPSWVLDTCHYKSDVIMGPWPELT